MEEPRIKFIDYDARRDPKTDRFSIMCQKDLKPDSKVKAVHMVTGPDGNTPYALHPDDETLWEVWNQNPDHDHGTWLLGNDCAKRLGLEWTRPE